MHSMWRKCAIALLLLTCCGPAAADHHVEPFTRSELRAHAAEVGVTLLTTPFSSSYLYVPSDGRASHPGVIVLHGSEGGSADYVDWSPAIPLAAKGYAVLSLDYFHNPGLPHSLENASVDAVIRAAIWLRTNGYVKGKPGLFGFSRGAEFALLIGSLDRGRQFSSIVVQSSHATTWPGLVLPPLGSDCEFCDYASGQPAWRFKGKGIGAFQAIDMWRFPGPVLLSHGKKDDVWSYLESVTLARVARLHGKKNVTLLLWSKEGHGLSSPALNSLIRKSATFFRKPTGA